MATNLFTFGYEGLSIDAFIARLKNERIRTVCDVRALPLSRKPGFSKRSFSEALQRAGIRYIHLPALGCPRPTRDQYKKDQDWEAYTKSFSAYLADQTDAVADLARGAKKTRSCLVCFEADFDQCHRSMVARAAVQFGGFRVVHITATEAIPDLPARAAA